MKRHFSKEVIQMVKTHTLKFLNMNNYQENASQNHTEMSPHTCQNGYYHAVNNEQVLGSM